MALVKMLRDIPEVAGGKTEAMIPEESVADAMKRGWKKADGKVEKTEPKPEKTEPKPEPKKEEPKVEPKVEEPVKEPEFPTFEKTEEKKGKK